MAKILIADDDETLAHTIAEYLRGAEHAVDITFTADETNSMMKAYEYDLLLIDWSFPDGAGIDLIKAHRTAGGLTPILMLTGKTSVEDKERGLDAGADDYLTKPFHMKELAARLRALTRRASMMAGDELKVGALVMNPTSRKLYLSGEEVKLRPMEFSVLEFFMRNPGKLFSPEKLLERVWESSTDVTLHAVYSCMKRLRQKLEKEGSAPIFKTAPGHGYELLKP